MPGASAMSPEISTASAPSSRIRRQSPSTQSRSTKFRWRSVSQASRIVVFCSTEDQEQRHSSGLLERGLARLEQTGEPVQDVQRHLAIVDARDVHAHLIRPSAASWAESRRRPRPGRRPGPCRTEGQALGPAGGRAVRRVHPRSERSTAVSASLRNGTLPSGPLSDWPVKVRTRLIRSESSRPRVIGWSPSRLFWRLKTSRASAPPNSPGPTVPVAHVHAEPLGQALGGRPDRGVVGDEQQGAAILDPVADGVALGVGELPGSPLAARWSPAAPSALAMTRMSPFWSTSRENFSRLGMTW